MSDNKLVIEVKQIKTDFGGKGYIVERDAFNRLVGEAQALQDEVERLNDAVSEFTIYESREIGESDWEQCDRSEYEYRDKSPEYDTRKRKGIDLAEVQAKQAEESYRQGAMYFAPANTTFTAIEMSANQHARQIREAGNNA